MTHENGGFDPFTRVLLGAAAGGLVSAFLLPLEAILPGILIGALVGFLLLPAEKLP